MDEELSYLDLGDDVGDVPDEVTVPPGEHELRLAYFEMVPTQKDPTRNQLVFTLEIVGEPLAKAIYHYTGIPKESDDPRKVIKMRRARKRIYDAFKIPTGGKINPQEYFGNTAWATVSEETDPKYGKQNRVTAFIGESK